DQAKRDLDHTVLRAPIAGMPTQVASIQMGRYVSAGTPVFSLIDDARPWVDANPKETDITHLRIGQPVTISGDTFPGGAFPGPAAAAGPGAPLAGARRGGRPRRGRAFRDPAAAECERKLGQGGAARAGADRIRAE